MASFSFGETPNPPAKSKLTGRFNLGKTCKLKDVRLKSLVPSSSLLTGLILRP